MKKLLRSFFRTSSKIEPAYFHACLWSRFLPLISSLTRLYHLGECLELLLVHTVQQIGCLEARFGLLVKVVCLSFQVQLIILELQIALLLAVWWKVFNGIVAGRSIIILASLTTRNMPHFTRNGIKTLDMTCHRSECFRRASNWVESNLNELMYMTSLQNM